MHVTWFLVLVASTILTSCKAPAKFASAPASQAPSIGEARDDAQVVPTSSTREASSPTPETADPTPTPPTHDETKTPETIDVTATERETALPLPPQPSPPAPPPPPQAGEASSTCPIPPEAQAFDRHYKSLHNTMTPQCQRDDDCVVVMGIFVSIVGPYYCEKYFVHRDLLAGRDPASEYRALLALSKCMPGCVHAIGVFPKCWQGQCGTLLGARKTIIP